MQDTLEDSIYQLIGERVKKRRTEQRKTQVQLASDVSMTRTSIANLEAGRQRPPLHVLYFIARALDIELRDVIPSSSDIRKREASAPGRQPSQLPTQAARLWQELAEQSGKPRR